MRAVALNHEVTALPELSYGRQLSVVVLGVTQALRGEALKKVVDVLVIRPAAFRLKAAGEEQLVGPVLLMVEDQFLYQRWVNAKEVIVRRFIAVLVHPPLLEIQDHILPSEVEQHTPVDPDAVKIGLLQQRLEPFLERWVDLDLVPR